MVENFNGYKLFNSNRDKKSVGNNLLEIILKAYRLSRETAYAAK